MNLPEKTLPQMLREHAQRQPAAVAIRQKDFGIWQPLTWAGYLRRASHIGLGLASLGLGPKSHVGVLSENRVEWVLAQMGTGLIGAVTVGVYPTSPTNEVAYVLGHADVEVVICEDQEQADKVLEAIDQLPKLRRIVVVETKGLASYSAAARERIVSFAELEAAGAA
ncbi:MAG: long-chain fatty acid--CoA ligase, partial [Comamonadaceae bacterium]